MENQLNKKEVIKIGQIVKIARAFISHLLISRPKVYWWSVVDRQGFDKENFGDILTPYIVEKLTGKKPVLFYPDSKFASYFKHCLMVGSIISHSKTNSTVWGSGIIRKDEKIEGGKFIAVRGPRTAQRLRELGFPAPDVYGDPAILLPVLYKPVIHKKYKFGLIAHYIDSDKLTEEIKACPDVHFINLLTHNIETVVNDILCCEKIVSTSLHGLIVAHSYGIPATWWKYSNKLSGDDIKFYDYFESVNLHDQYSNEGKTLQEVIDSNNYSLPERDQLAGMQRQLLRTFPYKKNLFNT